MNEVRTGCASCYYYFNGRCSWTEKCSYMTYITTNTIGEITSRMPALYSGNNTGYIYQGESNGD